MRMKEKPEIKTYTQFDICPICGIYTADGEVCIKCQKDYNVYKPKTTFNIIDIFNNKTC